jgi:hypothetical protein
MVVGTAADTRKTNTTMREVHRYPYTTADGVLLYDVVRFEPKDFRPQMPDGTWGLTVPRVLYRLPEVTSRRLGGFVWVCEGEKDADALAAEGLCATTAGSTSAWNACDISPLISAWGVILIPDCDDAGRKWAERAAIDLYKKGQRSVTILDLGGQDGYDVSDWLEYEGIDALMELRSLTPKYKWKPTPKKARRVMTGGAAGLPWELEDIVYELRGTVHGDSGKAYCPAHMDEGSGNAGLALKRTEDDRTLVFCHSGCEFTDIADAIKETMT